MSQIPKKIDSSLESFSTRNTKEAALLYSLAEVQPQTNPDGSLSAMRVKDPKTGDEICWFNFQDGKLSQMVHSAFANPDWINRHAGAIPDEYVPVVLSLILTMWSNWERLKEATKGMPLHNIVKKNNKIYIGVAKGSK